MSRRTVIIDSASERAEAILARNSKKSATVRLRLIQLNQVCRDYVSCIPPRNVTASAVCTELSLQISPGEKPPSVSTIYNNPKTYGAIVDVWRSAYGELKQIKADRMPSPVAQLANAAFEHMDPGTANMVRLLQASLKEQIQINNELQEFITIHIPITAFGEVALQSDVLDGFEDWIDWISGRGFTIDAEAVRVSSRTGIGTPIIPIELFNSIKDAVGRFSGAAKLKKSNPRR